METFKTLEEKARQLPTPSAQRQLGEFAANVHHRKDVMDHLKVHHHEIAVKVVEYAKPFEVTQKQLERELDLTLDRER